MTRILLRWVPLTVGATLIAGGVLFLAPVDTALTVKIYVLVVGALALLTLVAATAHAAGSAPSEFERVLVRPRRRAVRPDDLERLERQVALAQENAFDFYSRLRPALIDAASAALWRNHGVDVATQPDRARELLPPEVWEVVRPDAERPSDRHAQGPSLRRIDALVTGIERMST
jgi:hypothetical protein